MYFEIYRDNTVGAGGLLSSNASQWRWRLKAGNGETIASGESYHNKVDCVAAIDLVKGTNKDTSVMEI